ncbi:amidohydrolase, partial [Cutibacterium acnes]
LRNAIDHGVDSPEARRARGKPAEASVTLEARHSAGSLLVSVIDDGPGVDMDALPIEEASGVAYASKVPGKMHACGHDGHTAMLLCAARHLAATRQFSGTLNLIFQPAEEGQGGAEAMLADGLLERFPCDALFGMHNMPGLPAGHLGFREGPMMASQDLLTVTLDGVGGHGSMPHLTVDPLV